MNASPKNLCVSEEEILNDPTRKYGSVSRPGLLGIHFLFWNSFPESSGSGF